MKPDAGTTRLVRQQVARRYIDCSMVDIKVSHGVVHFSGVIRNLRSYPGIDLKKEMETLTNILVRMGGIRDVTWDVMIRA